MAALRDIARDFAAEIRDGIGWTIVYRTGRSWNALTIWSDIWNGEWETDDLNDAIGILKADPDAVIVNGYYCGHFGEGMTIDEIAAGIRWHYEGGHNRLADYCEVTQGRDALEEGRKAAEAAGLPFCERLADGGDDELSPYVYDGSMALADHEKMQQAREAFLTQTGKVVRKVRAKSIDNMKRKIRKFRGLVDSGEMTLDSVVQSYASWTGHISHGNTYHLRQNMDAYFFSYFPELKPSPKGDTTHGPKTEQPRKQVEGQVRQPVRQPDRLDRGR